MRVHKQRLATKLILVRDANWSDEEKRVVDSLAVQMSRLQLQQQKATGVWPQLRKFCADSSLHAVKYVTDRNTHLIERVFWAVVFSVSVFACVPPILKAWHKFSDDSLSVVLQQNPEPVWKIPFPEVIICNEAVLRADLITNSTQNLTVANGLSVFCNELSSNESQPGVREKELLEFIQMYHVQLNDFFGVQRFQTIRLNASEHLTPKLTNFGVCFSFNALPFDQLYSNESSLWLEKKQERSDKVWDTEKGFSGQHVDANHRPQRVLSSGLSNSYTALLRRSKKFILPACAPPNAGFKVAVKNPADAWVEAGEFLRLSMGRETNVVVTPRLVATADGDTRSMPPEARLCYFVAERRLRFFNIYTQKNCRAECLANLTLRHCACVALHMPRSRETLICAGRRSKRCVTEQTGKFELDVVHGAVEQKWGPCGCLPACTSLTYAIDVFNADLMSADNDAGFLAVYFKQAEFFPLVRIKQFDFLAFLSTCGGLLGLFLGFSLLSLVEVLFFLCVRPALVCAKRFFIVNENN